jgi:hypothetical protein
MKLEIVKEEKYGEPTWFLLRVDNMCMKASKNLEEVEHVYNELLDNPDLLIHKKTILKSDEISVNLQEK